MSLSAIRDAWRPAALCGCDGCGASVTLPAQHGAARQRGHCDVASVMTLQSPAAVVTALRKRGWSQIKGRLLCPACTENRRKPQKEGVDMAGLEALEALREPTLDQRGDIIEALTVYYDRKARRYKDDATDKSIAALIGGGCLPGWVTTIREANFGPSGANAEMEVLRADIDALKEGAGQLGATLEAVQAEANRQKDALVKDLAAKVAALAKRLDAVIAAVGPKAGAK